MVLLVYFNHLKKFLEQNKKNPYINEEEDHQENMHSPMRMNYPQKIHMKNNTIEDTKYIIPPLDLSKTKIGGKSSNNSNYNQKNNADKSNLKPEEILKLRRKNFEIEEWQETVKKVCLSEEEIDRYFNNKMLHKLIDAIENLIKIITKRNENLNIIKEENMSLSSQYSQLKNEQLNLTSNYFLLKEKYKELENQMHNSYKTDELLDSSMVIIICNYISLKNRLITQVEYTTMENTDQIK
jgi:hypothetical protein